MALSASRGAPQPDAATTPAFDKPEAFVGKPEASSDTSGAAAGEAVTDAAAQGIGAAALAELLVPVAAEIPPAQAAPAQPLPASLFGSTAIAVATSEQSPIMALSASRGGPSGPTRAETSAGGAVTADLTETASLAFSLDPDAATLAAPFAAPAPAPSPATAEAPANPPAPSLGPVPLGAVPMTIGLRALAGSNTFEIRLDPKDLGRIEVNLAIDKETGAVQASLLVDRPETLALIQRDAGNLQQALAQAGLDAPDGSITVSLRQDGAGGDASGGAGAQGRESGGRGEQRRPETHAQDKPIAAVPLRLFGAGRGLDIRI